MAVNIGLVALFLKFLLQIITLGYFSNKKRKKSDEKKKQDEQEKL